MAVNEFSITLASGLEYTIKLQLVDGYAFEVTVGSNPPFLLEAEDLPKVDELFKKVTALRLSLQLAGQYAAEN